MKLIQIQTKLETASIDDVSIILDRKVSDVGVNRTVDYIGTALDNIDSAVNRIDEAIKEHATQQLAENQKEIAELRDRLRIENDETAHENVALKEKIERLTQLKATKAELGRFNYL